MAVKLAAAMGAEVTVLSGSPSKAADARRLGAHEFVSTRDEGAMRGLRKRLDLLIDTVSAPHDYDGLLELLRPFGTLVLVALPPEKVPLGASALILGNRRLAGSLIGGIGETQEMIDFCAARGIVSDIEVIPMQRINEAYERVLRADVRYRFVIDLASLRT